MGKKGRDTLRLTNLAAGPERPGGRARRRGGRTNWRRFGLASLAATLLATGTVATTTAAEIPVSFAVAGNPFTVTAEHLEATGATQFASFREDAKGSSHPVTVVGIRSASIEGLCQSAVARTPLGAVTLIIRSNGDAPVTARNVALDITRLTGDMTFHSVEMGRDAATLDSSGIVGTPGTYGQQARSLTVENARLQAWSLTAGMFSLTGSDMSVQRGEQTCS
ncbi:DUF6230 family protein [Streptomyces sp. NPDC002784]